MFYEFKKEVFVHFMMDKKYCVYLKKDRAIAGIGNLEEALALVESFYDRNPIVIEADKTLEEIWARDKIEATSIVADKLLALELVKRVKETDEPFPHLKTAVERVVYLLAKYPELRNPRDEKNGGKFTREPQIRLYKTIFPDSQGDTARRAFAYVQNTLRMYPPDEETQMWQVWSAEQFREFFNAMNAEQFRGYAEKVSELASSGILALLEQALGDDWKLVNVSINDVGLLTVEKKRYLTDKEFWRITKALRPFGIKYDRDAHLWFGGTVKIRR